MILIVFIILLFVQFCPACYATGIGRPAAEYIDGSSLINKMLDAASNLDNYSSDYQMLVYKSNKTVEEVGTIYFRKPRLFRVEIIKGPQKGTLAILCADGRIHGHLGGIMKYFNFAISANSHFARTINNFPMVGTDFYSLVVSLKDMLQNGDLSQVTNQPVSTDKTSTTAYILNMYGVDKNNQTELLIKRIYVSPETYLPTHWEDYINGKLSSQSQWQNLQSNLTLSDGLFKP